MNRKNATLASTLVRKIFSVYLVFAAGLTLFHIGLTYQNTYAQLIDELEVISQAFEPGISAAMWSYQEPMIQSIAKGIVGRHAVIGVDIRDTSGRIKITMTQNRIPLEELKISKRLELFHHLAPGMKEPIGSLTLYSNADVVIERVKYSVLWILFSAVLKTIGLWLIIVFFVNRWLAHPLRRITEQIKELDLNNDAHVPPIDSGSIKNVELEYLCDTFNNMTGKVAEHKQALQQLATNLENEVHDRTADLNQALTEAEAARAAADAANQAKSEFLAIMSHEIRTPMNGVLGLSHLALQGQTDAPQRDYLLKIQLSATNLLRVLNDILDFSKIEADKLAVERVAFHLGTVLDNVGNVALPQAEKKGVQLQFAIDPDVPADLMGDPLRLEQVFANLVNNAVKFTERGEIVISIGVAGRCEHHIELCCAVRDTGIGMSTEQLSRLFQPFAQVDSSTTRRFGGTGLGLVISECLVQLMGGRIKRSTVRPASAAPSIFPYGLHYSLKRSSIAPQKG